MPATNKRPRTKPSNWTTVRKVPSNGEARPARTGNRDSQQSKVYQAEKMAQHLLLGNYWTQSMTELQVLDLMEQALNHPGVIARWGEHNATVSFPDKGTSAWSVRSSGRIHLPPGTRNPLTVLHEIAHLFAPARQDADHGPGFVSIYRYIVTLVLGEEAGRLLDAAFSSLGVRSDDSLIPPPRTRHGARASDGLPGLLPGQAEQAAEIVRLAAAAGVFGEPGHPTRTAAFSVARRLKSLEARTPAARRPPARIPEHVTLRVASLLDADDRDDLAEVVLGEVRRSMAPALLRPAQEEPRAAARKRRRKKPS